MLDPREARFNSADKSADQRGPFARDRDRILYSSAFRRLGGVTQVVWANEEGRLLHNRLTHSLKVAQLARRIAEKFCDRASSDPNVAEAIAKNGGLDPEVAEAAGLGHDLGHPPFGHVGEQELDRCVRLAGLSDGFEGNAQSFRIVGRLARSTPNFEGLNLTRATLNAVLKYPVGWRAGARKWGFFNEDRELFDWARSKSGLLDGQKSLEASIMDWADDITYAVHDVEDFYRAGLIPLHDLPAWRRDERGQRLFKRVIGRWKDGPVPSPLELEQAAEATLELPWASRAFTASPTERANLRLKLGQVIGRFVGLTEITATGLEIPRAQRIEIAVLQELTQLNVIDGPQLGTQQVGQRRIVRGLFNAFRRGLAKGAFSMFPGGWRESAEAATASPDAGTRLVADLVSSLTEVEAVRFYRRFTGTDFGAFVDPVG